MDIANETVDSISEEQCELKTVLLVDDDAKLLRGLERHLADDYRILTAISPSEASVIAGREHVDLILSDNLMAGELGTEFLKKMGEKYPNIKLLMLSGYLPNEVAYRIVNDYGVTEVLTKPCEMTEVTTAIQNALGQRRDEVE